MYTDVWSFGIVLYEMFTRGARPYGEWDNIRVQMEVVNGYRLEQPDSCPDAVFFLMMQCWEADPHNRPLFPKVNDMLTHIKTMRRLEDPRKQLSLDERGDMSSQSVSENRARQVLSVSSASAGTSASTSDASWIVFANHGSLAHNEHNVNASASSDVSWKRCYLVQRMHCMH